MSDTSSIRRFVVGISLGLCVSVVAPPALLAADGDAPKNKQGGDKGGAKSEKGADKGADKGNDKAEKGDKAGDKAEKAGDKGQVKAPEQPQNRRAPAGKGYDRLRMGPNGIPMTADKTRSIEAKRDLDDAKTELTKNLSTTGSGSTAAVENELWKNDEYRESMIELRKTQADYDAVRRPIFDALRADQYYKELEKKQRDSQRVISNLVLTGRGSFDWLFPHAMAAMEVRNRMTREEIIAMAQAPEVEDARQRMLMTAAKVRAMRSNYVAQSTNSDSARAAKADLDTARDKVKSAQQEYNAALAEEADYERVRQDYLTELRRTGKAPVSN